MNRLWIVCPICRKRHIFRRCRWTPIGQTEQGWDVHVAPVGTVLPGNILEDIEKARELVAAGNYAVEADLAVVEKYRYEWSTE